MSFPKGWCAACGKWADHESGACPNPVFERYVVSETGKMSIERSPFKPTQSRTQPGLDEKRVMAAFDFARQLETELSQAREEVERLKLRATCDVCFNQPLPSGKKCICGGTGDMGDAATGYRVMIYDLEKGNAELREAFNTWSEHQPGCPTGWGKQCDCGLAELRAKVGDL